MLTVLGGLAEFERELIRSRTGEGRERAKARGVVIGRKPKLTRHKRQEAIARRESGESLVDMRSLLTNALGALVASEDAVRKEVEGPRAEWLLAWARARPAQLEHSRRVRFCVQRSV